MMGHSLDQENRAGSYRATLVDVDIICHIIQQGPYCSQVGSTDSAQVMPAFVR
jgi:hypothetical protein